MNKNSLLTFLVLVIPFIGMSQNLSQTIRGTVLDVDNHMPLPMANIIIVDSDPIIGVTTDINGKFRLEEVPIGRITLKVSYLGYESGTLADIVVNSGKEVVLNINLQQAFTTTQEVVITANRDQNNGDVLNEMAIASAQSISPEQSKRYAGGFNDPGRILSNLAGVTSTQNGENDLIVRGNSPKYIQWRLEGVEITNPTHFADQNAAKGGISAINNDLLSTSDFYTGAFAPEFGNALSGVYDVKLRSGNNEKFEAAFGFGALGTDLTLEGPFKKGYGGSYLINYRYSAIGLVNDLGLVDIEGSLTYQDMAFKVVLPTKKQGVFSLFGLAGISGFDFTNVDPQIQSTPGQDPSDAQLSEDYIKDNSLANIGLKHLINIGKDGLLKTTFSYASSGIDEDVFIIDSIQGTKDQSFKGRLARSSYSGETQYSRAINPRNKIQIGTKYSLIGFDNNQSQSTTVLNGLSPILAFNEDITMIRNHVSWRHRINESLSLLTGVHNVNVLPTNESTIEPRAAVQYRINNSSTFKAGYGNHSSMESIHNYFAIVEQADGGISEPNKDLQLLKAHHFVMSLDKQFSKNLKAKVEIYYQDLYDLPVENLDTSHYATINEGTDFRYLELVNEGKGKNYGIELTLERFFTEDFYFLINGSFYESKYTPMDGIERNTQYNGNYQANLLLGKEWMNLGAKKNRTLALNIRTFMGGGQKYIPLFRDENGNAALNPSTGDLYDYSNVYEESIDDIFQLDFTASYKINSSKATHELFLSLVNLTNNQGRISEVYNPSEPDSVGYVTQFGTFPNLMYRVYF